MITLDSELVDFGAKYAKNMGHEIDSPEISPWIQQIRDGNAAGIDEAWSRFFARMVGCVGKRTRGLPESIINPEDVAASVFESAWRASHEGRLASITDGEGLWWWLLRIARFKIADHLRQAMKKSSGGNAPHVSIDDGILPLISCEPDAAYCAILKDELSRLMELLSDEKMRAIAIMKLEGYSNREIERDLNIAPATVVRKLRIIRTKWSKAMPRSST